MNPYLTSTFLPVVVAIGITCYLLIQLVPVARKMGLVDKPTDRKIHEAEVPVVGGIAIFLAILFSLLLVPFGLDEYRIVIFGAGLLMVVGVLDDHQDISAKSKFVVQVFVAVMLVYGNDTFVTSIGDILNWQDGNQQGLSWLARPLTVIAIVGVINAFNMIDGHDGLAAGVFLLMTATLIVLCGFNENWKYQYLLVLFFVSTLVFFFFNTGWFLGRDRQSFLGDSGSMLLGFVLAYTMIVLSGDEMQTIRKTCVPWVLGLPLFDMATVLVTRIFVKVSLIGADRRHIHHLLINNGYTGGKVLLILIVIQALFCAVAIVGTILDLADWLMFWSLIPTLLCYAYFRFRFARLAPSIRRS